MQRLRVLRWILPGVLLAAVLAGAAGCAIPLPVGEAGAVPMAPFVDEESGLQGMAPLPGWAENAELVQQTGPGTIDDLVAILREQTDLVSLPRAMGTYQGKHLSWDLYVFASQLTDAPPGIYHMRMGVAQKDGKIYFAVLVVVPDTYRANQALYDTVFEHALYALGPVK